MRSQRNGAITVAWVTRYLIAINFLFILFVASVYLREQKVIISLIMSGCVRNIVFSCLSYFYS